MIGLFSISDELGGAEQILLKIAKFYSINLKYEVKVFVFKEQTNNFWVEKLKDAEVVYLDKNIFLLTKYLQKYSFDMVFSSHLMINALLGLLRSFQILKTEKLIVRESTQVFGRYTGFKLLKYKLAYFIGYRKIDLVICQTQKMSNSLRTNVSFLFNRTKIYTVPNPFEYPSNKEVHEQIDLINPFLVTAGRLIPEKGFEVLIDAYYKFHKRHPNYKLVILGQGEMLNNLQQQIIKLSLEEHVVLKGQVKNVYPYFKEAEICVVSSLKEGFPNVLLQMMSQNERVVSTNCAGGISEFKGIFVAKVNDIDDLYSKLIDAKKANVSGNRFIFDNELKNRTVANFIYKLNELL